MTLFEQIQADRRQAMEKGRSTDPKLRDKCKINLLGCLIADASRDKKSPDDDVVMRTIKSTMKALKETQAAVDRKPPEGEAQYYHIDRELNILQSYLPKMVSQDELTKFINEVAGSPDKKQFGRVMGEIKKKFGSKVDMSLASKILKEIL